MLPFRMVGADPPLRLRGSCAVVDVSPTWDLELIGESRHLGFPFYGDLCRCRPNIMIFPLFCLSQMLFSM